MVNLKGEGSVDGAVEQFYLKPMNCPMHHQIYLHKPRSYRELPYRLMEYGTVYRYEESGTLTGLIRVRGFTQNDAHVYCMRSQLFEVISEALARFLRAYQVLGIRDYKIRFSLPDFENNAEKYGPETQEWRDAISAMQAVLDELGVEYYEALNEAAFYGPKIDIQVRNVNGKEDSLSTIQVDYSIAPKFGITYVGPDGKEETPAIIHMALMGSIDRFMAFMIEMNAGRFPFWVAPEQVRILTVTDAVAPYASQVAQILRETALMKPLRYNEVRFSLDDRAESLGKKVRGAELDKIPVVLIIGEQDMANRTVSIRTRDGESTIALDALVEFLHTFA
jgi:threonyl-tRNA synthetase